MIAVYQIDRNAFPSGENFGHHAAVNIGQTKVASGVPIRQFRVVQTEQVQHRGVQIMDVDSPLDGAVAVFIARPVDEMGI